MNPDVGRTSEVQIHFSAVSRLSSLIFAAILATLSARLVDADPTTRKLLPDEPGPSTLESRANFMRASDWLERNPLHPSAPEVRAWAVRWILDDPDVIVTFSLDVLPGATTKSYKYHSEILAQMGCSSAVYQIRNPAMIGNEEAQFLAQADGALRLYRRLLEIDPEARLPYLDDLLRSGQIREHVLRNLRDKSAPASLSPTTPSVSR